MKALEMTSLCHKKTSLQRKKTSFQRKETSFQCLTPMTQSPYTLYKRSLHLYQPRFTPMTDASVSVFQSTFHSIPKRFSRYLLFHPSHSLMQSTDKFPENRTVREFQIGNNGSTIQSIQSQTHKKCVHSLPSPAGLRRTCHDPYLGFRSSSLLIYLNITSQNTYMHHPAQIAQ